jgi:hypothetical protein
MRPMNPGLFLLFAACDVGDPLALDASAVGPTIAVGAEPAAASFTVLLEPESEKAFPPTIDMGWSADLAFTGTGTIRTLVYTGDADQLVPTPWDTAVDGTATLTRNSGEYHCDGAAPSCEALVQVGWELVDGYAIDVDWTVTAWARARGGGGSTFTDATVLTVTFPEAPP